VTSPFRGAKGAPTYRRDVSYATLRSVLSNVSCEQGQYLSPGTDKVYKRVSKSKNWKEDTIELENGAKGHWIGKRDAKYVMLYCHGS
jgi:hypothetical protein